MLKRIYTVVKIALCIFIIGLSVFIDSVLIGRGSYGLLCIFVLLEALMLVYSFLLYRYIDKIIITMQEKNGVVLINTFGSAYKVKLSDIRVIKGKWNFYYVCFGRNKLRVYPSNKDANALIRKYFVRISD